MQSIFIYSEHFLVNTIFMKHFFGNYAWYDMENWIFEKWWGQCKWHLWTGRPKEGEELNKLKLEVFAKYKIQTEIIIKAWNELLCVNLLYVCFCSGWVDCSFQILGHHKCWKKHYSYPNQPSTNLPSTKCYIHYWWLELFVAGDLYFSSFVWSKPK